MVTVFRFRVSGFSGSCQVQSHSPSSIIILEQVNHYYIILAFCFLTPETYTLAGKIPGEAG